MNKDLKENVADDGDKKVGENPQDPASVVSNVGLDSGDSSLTDFKPKLSQRGSKTDQGITLMWTNLNVWTGPSKKIMCGLKKSKTSSKHILKDVIGIARPGEVMALMGSSGAGKTTLLNVLNQRNLRNLKVTGERMINGVPVDAEHLKSNSAYVQQDDLFINTLTVREYLTFHAILRLPGNVSKKDRKKRVEQVLTEFGLVKCQNTMIGSPWTSKGCSGGELKRLSFACEFLMDPAIMFCDEPTSGLDSFMASNVIQTLKNMAAKGKTIICTIHQPPSDVFALFDKIFLLAEGRVAFCGDKTDAIIFFENLGYRSPKNYNPADFFIKTLAISPVEEALCRKRAAEICDDFEKSPYYQDIKEQATLGIKSKEKVGLGIKNLTKKKKKSKKGYNANWCIQLSTLTWRSGLTVLRDPMVLGGKLIETVGLALLLGLMFYGQELNSEGIMNLKGGIFMSVLSISFISIFGIITVFCAELPIFLREHRNGMYRCDVYFLSKLIAEIPLQIVSPILFTSVFYWLIGFNPIFERFVIACGIQLLNSYAAAGFAYLISCGSKSVAMAVTILALPLIPLMVFSGFFQDLEAVPKYLRWIKYLSWMNFAHDSLSINQWSGLKDINCTFAYMCSPTGDILLEAANIDKDNFDYDLEVLAILISGYFIAAFLVLLFKSYRKT